MDGYGHSGIVGIGGVSYVALTLPLLLFFRKNFLLAKRCDEAMKKRHCRLVSAVIFRGLAWLEKPLGVSNASGQAVRLANAQRHL